MIIFWVVLAGIVLYHVLGPGLYQLRLHRRGRYRRDAR
jgi:hypothetical protein